MPIGHAVNPRVAMVTGFSCHRDHDEARKRGVEGFDFFKYGLGHHYGFGQHKPGHTSLWADFHDARTKRWAETESALDADPFTRSLYDVRGLGTPEELRARYASFEAAGVDQIIFLQQSGRNRHEHICEALELFAKSVMTPFKDRHDKSRAARDAALEPATAWAMARKERRQALGEAETPVVSAVRPDLSPLPAPGTAD